MCVRNGWKPRAGSFPGKTSKRHGQRYILKYLCSLLNVSTFFVGKRITWRYPILPWQDKGVYLMCYPGSTVRFKRSLFSEHTWVVKMSIHQKGIETSPLARGRGDVATEVGSRRTWMPGGEAVETQSSQPRRTGKVSVINSQDLKKEAGVQTVKVPHGSPQAYSCLGCIGSLVPEWNGLDIWAQPIASALTDRWL